MLDHFVTSCPLGMCGARFWEAYYISRTLKALHCTAALASRRLALLRAHSESTCSLRSRRSPRLLPPSGQGAGVETSPRECRNRPICPARRGFSTSGLPLSALRSKRPVFVGVCFSRPIPVMSSGTQWSRDISSNPGNTNRTRRSLERLLHAAPPPGRGSGRSDLCSLGCASPDRWGSCRAERTLKALPV